MRSRLECLNMGKKVRPFSSEYTHRPPLAMPYDGNTPRRLRSMWAWWGECGHLRAAFLCAHHVLLASTGHPGQSAAKAQAAQRNFRLHHPESADQQLESSALSGQPLTQNALPGYDFRVRARCRATARWQSHNRVIISKMNPIIITIIYYNK